MRSLGVQTDLAPLHLSDPISPAQMPIFSVAGCSPYKYKLHTGWKDLRQDFRLALQSPVRCHLRISCCGAQAFQYDLTGWARDVAGAVRGRSSRRESINCLATYLTAELELFAELSQPLVAQTDRRDGHRLCRRPPLARPRREERGRTASCRGLPSSVSCPSGSPGLLSGQIQGGRFWFRLGGCSREQPFTERSGPDLVYPTPRLLWRSPCGQS